MDNIAELLVFDDFTIGKLIFGLSSAVIVFFAIRILRLGLQSKSWASTEGKVVLSHFLEGDKGLPRLEFRYTYEVDGMSYSSERAMFTPPMVFGDGTIIAERYRAGDTVRVYFDTLRPEKAVLETSLWNKTNAFWSVITISLILLPMIIFGSESTWRVLPSIFLIPGALHFLDWLLSKLPGRKSLLA